MKRTYFLVISAVFALLVACAPDAPSGQDAAKAKADARQPYVQKNDIEFNNYNKRQIVSDDPTTILWCTSAFPVTGAPLFTVPVAGKLTSGSKRPWPDSQVQYESSYSPELPGPDGMYGSSGDYRYGFTPGGQYVDFYNMQTFCTTEPTVWQKDSTTIVTQTDQGLLAAQKQAQALMAQGKNAEAQAVLSKAVGGR